LGRPPRRDDERDCPPLELGSELRSFRHRGLRNSAAGRWTDAHDRGSRGEGSLWLAVRRLDSGPSEEGTPPRTTRVIQAPGWRDPPSMPSRGVRACSKASAHPARCSLSGPGRRVCAASAASVDAARALPLSEARPRRVRPRRRRARPCCGRPSAPPPTSAHTSRRRF
jgi:hypothetical protein